MVTCLGRSVTDGNDGCITCLSRVDVVQASGMGCQRSWRFVRLHSCMEVTQGPMSLAAPILVHPRGQNSLPPPLGLEGCLSPDDVLNCIVSLDQWAVLSLVFGPALVLRRVTEVTWSYAGGRLCPARSLRARPPPPTPPPSLPSSFSFSSRLWWLCLQHGGYPAPR